MSLTIPEASVDATDRPETGHSLPHVSPEQASANAGVDRPRPRPAGVPVTVRTPDGAAASFPAGLRALVFVSHVDDHLDRAMRYLTELGADSVRAVHLGRADTGLGASFWARYGRALEFVERGQGAVRRARPSCVPSTRRHPSRCSPSSCPAPSRPAAVASPGAPSGACRPACSASPASSSSTRPDCHVARCRSLALAPDASPIGEDHGSLRRTVRAARTLAVRQGENGRCALASHIILVGPRPASEAGSTVVQGPSDRAAATVLAANGGA